MSTTSVRCLELAALIGVLWLGAVSSQESISSEEKIKQALERAYEEGRTAGYAKGYADGLQAGRTSGVTVPVGPITVGRETLGDWVADLQKGAITKDEFADRVLENQAQLQ